MPLKDEDLSEIINQPSESLSKEVKNWFDPASFLGISKIVKACLALRNHDGGLLLIGFDNQNGQFNRSEAPQKVRESFHVDMIQGYITKYSSEPFEILVYYPVIEESACVVIEVPQGLRTPVAIKSDLIDKNNSVQCLRSGEVFVRTLNSNNTPSSAKVNWRDWPDLIDKCFNNREADIGRFIRRHLRSSLSIESKKAILSLIEDDKSPEQTEFKTLKDFLDLSHERYEMVYQEKGISAPIHGSMEVAVITDGINNVHSANQNFLNLLLTSNPGLTGFPLWIDSRGFGEHCEPFTYDGVWEALVSQFETGFFDHLDYWRLSPEGGFYLYRALQDDIGGSQNAPNPMTALDVFLTILRVAEAIIVAVAFAKAMGANEKAELQTIFRWKGLKGRKLSSWANPDQFLSTSASSYQDEVVSAIIIPVDTAPSAISGYVSKLTRPLFEAFDGFELSSDTADEMVERLQNRKLF